MNDHPIPIHSHSRPPERYSPRVQGTCTCCRDPSPDPPPQACQQLHPRLRAGPMRFFFAINWTFQGLIVYAGLVNVYIYIYINMCILFMYTCSIVKLIYERFHDSPKSELFPHHPPTSALRGQASALSTALPNFAALRPIFSHRLHSKVSVV